MDLALLGNVAGGIGLFLLGMMLMTDGLKLAAGRALRHILSEWTRTPMRGFFSGILITSLVQASGAVTVATIGFVNAGLLGLLETVYVIFGSNVGTTMTGWLVVLVGFQVDVKAMALPLIAVGMILRLTGRGRRRGAFGVALAGFGLFFLGIDILKTTFEHLGRDFPIASWAREDFLGVLLFVGIGFVLTFLMQSSSAAIAITLTAAGGGLVPLADAAAVVIGANLGTTSTAALAVIGATANAQRVAAAHVAFNLLTGLVALVVLVPLLSGIQAALALLGEAAAPATVLALFHTVFNVLGVLLMWPITRRLVTFLEQRFRRSDEDEARPRFLDKNVVGTPALALEALASELTRTGRLVRDMAKSALSSEGVPEARLAEDQRVLMRLTDAVRQFTVQAQRTDLPEELSEALPNVMRVARYYDEAAEAAVRIAAVQQGLGDIEDPELADAMADFRCECVALVECADTGRTDFSAEGCRQRLADLERRYQDLKALLLRSGARGRLQVRQMVAQLDQYSDVRRMMEQVFKGADYLHEVLDVAARYRAPHKESEAPTGP